MYVNPYGEQKKAKKKILIVDDEVDFTNLVKMGFEETGEYEVKTENRGSQALAAARQFMPDIVILDVMMPDADGGSIAKQFEADFQLNTIPIVFLTAIVTEGEITSGKSSIGNHPVIAKPITMKNLIKQIEKNLSNRNQ